MAEQVEGGARQGRPDRGRHVRLRPVDGLGRLCRRQAVKAGFRSNNIDPNARHCMASAVAGFMRTFGIDEPMGCYDDIEHADAFVLWGSNMAEMHPILWSRLTDRRLTNPGCEGARCCRPSSTARFELADNGMIFTPQTDLAILNYIANHIIQNGRGEPGLRRQERQLQEAATPTSATACAPTIRCEKEAGQRYPSADGKPKGNGGDRSRSPSRSTPSSSPSTRSRRSSKLSGVPAERLEALAELYADPKHEGDVASGRWASTSTRAAPGSTT